MINIIISVVGKERSQPMLELQAEYMKRTSWKINVQEHKQNVSQALESNALISNLPQSSKIILLDETGILLSSVAFAEIMKKMLDSGIKDCAFLIGGAHGHSTALKNQNNTMISLSKMTFPHKLARLLLIEQLYRAHTIISGHPYHKE